MMLLAPSRRASACASVCESGDRSGLTCANVVSASTPRPPPRLGEVDEAFRWLEQGYEQRASFMNGIKAETGFQSLHADPRWSILLGRMGLRP